MEFIGVEPQEKVHIRLHSYTDDKNTLLECINAANFFSEDMAEDIVNRLLRSEVVKIGPYIREVAWSICLSIGRKAASLDTDTEDLDSETLSCYVVGGESR